MTVRLSLLLGLAIFVAAGFALTFGEVALTAEQYRLAFSDAASVEAEVLWAVRAPRIVCALLVGAALGLSGAVLQGLLRNPLADPGVLGV